jgi:hypothetical protein
LNYADCHVPARRYSLKAVLPALVPDLTYEGMEVANGQDAGLADFTSTSCPDTQGVKA